MSEAAAGGSQRCVATILFADVSGFTAMSRKLDPEDVTDIMNRCFRMLEAIVNRHGGNAEILMLRDAGLAGNTHIPFADLNNVAVADLLSDFLETRGLSARRK